MEIVTGLWIGSYHLLNNTDWCKEKKIQTIMNCHKYYELNMEIDKNYNMLEKTVDFISRSIEKLVNTHYRDNQNCLIVCTNGRRMSLLIVIYYLSKLCNISKERALEIIKTKYQNMVLDDYIIRYLK